MSQRDIGIDQGQCNFAIVVVDGFIGQRPKLVKALLYDLDLPLRFTASDVLLKLVQNRDLWNFMQQEDELLLPAVDRVVVHLEQMSTKNRHWKQFGPELGKLLQRSVKDVNTCIVKLS